jgi:hypothetical protein
MRTADAVKYMALMADARVVAFIREYQKQVIDPYTMRLFQMWERQQTRNKLRAFLGRCPIEYTVGAIGGRDAG